LTSAAAILQKADKRPKAGGLLALIDDPVTDAANYTITTVGGVVTITDLSGVDGTDTLYNMERAGFCTTNDANTGACTAFEYVTLGGSAPAATLSVTSLGFADRAVPALASAPQIVTLTNSGGGTLNITSTTITGANATSFARTTACTTLAAGASCTINVTFDPTAAAALTATLAIVTNAGTANVTLTGTGINNTAATGNPTISDTTPTEGTAITAAPGIVADVNGVPGVLSYQWLQSTTPGGAANVAIAGATSPTFTPLQAQSNRRLAVRVSFVDNAGTLENRTSATTIVVGDLFPASAMTTLASTTSRRRSGRVPRWSRRRQPGNRRRSRSRLRRRRRRHGVDSRWRRHHHCRRRRRLRCRDRWRRK
jgi:hypothetical protein